jgi:hypothetical protein
MPSVPLLDVGLGLLPNLFLLTINTHERVGEVESSVPDQASY